MFVAELRRLNALLGIPDTLDKVDVKDIPEPAAPRAGRGARRVSGSSKYMSNSNCLDVITLVTERGRLRRASDRARRAPGVLLGFGYWGGK